LVHCRFAFGLLPTLVALNFIGCSDEVEIAKTTSGGAAGAPTLVGLGQGNESASGASTTGGVANGKPKGAAGASGASATGGAIGSAGAGPCELRAISWPGDTTSSPIQAGLYCDFWYVCFVGTDEARAAAASTPQLACTAANIQGCTSPVRCQYTTKDRALGEDEYAQLCAMASASSVEIVCAHLE
jgi:hypothetical protein